MISATLRVFALIAVTGYFVILFYLLRKKTLNLKYTLVWMLAGLLMALLAAFPKLLNRIAALVGIYDATNALFAICCFCLILISISLTAIASRQNSKIRQLVQFIAILEQRVRVLEENAKESLAKEDSLTQ